MPMPIIPKPQFPNVPDVPGVPALVRIAGAPVIASANALLTRVGLGQFAFGLEQPVWGVFDSQNQPIAVTDSFGGIEFRSDSRTSSAPMEQGGFNSYNKVQLPFEARVRLHRGGTIEENKAFLEAIDDAKNSVNLYTIVTPEATYPDVSIERYDYRRETRNGATLITVDIGVLRIRVQATATFSSSSNLQNPASASPESQGQVQAVDVGAPIVSAIQVTPLP